MQTTVNQRIKILIDNLRMNKSSFATSISKSPAVIGRIVEGDNNPSYDIFLSILDKYPKVNANWLINGSGSVYNDKVNESNLLNETVIDVIKESNKDLRREVDYLTKELEYIKSQNERLLLKY